MLMSHVFPGILYAIVGIYISISIGVLLKYINMGIKGSALFVIPILPPALLLVVIQGGYSFYKTTKEAGALAPLTFWQRILFRLEVLKYALSVYRDLFGMAGTIFICLSKEWKEKDSIKIHKSKLVDLTSFDFHKIFSDRNINSKTGMI